jgi:hypothetical protein
MEEGTIRGDELSGHHLTFQMNKNYLLTGSTNYAIDGIFSPQDSIVPLAAYGKEPKYVHKSAFSPDKTKTQNKPNSFNLQLKHQQNGQDVKPDGTPSVSIPH